MNVSIQSLQSFSALAEVCTFWCIDSSPTWRLALKVNRWRGIVWRRGLKNYIASSLSNEENDEIFVDENLLASLIHKGEKYLVVSLLTDKHTITKKLSSKLCERYGTHRRNDHLQIQDSQCCWLNLRMNKKEQIKKEGSWTFDKMFSFDEGF